MTKFTNATSTLAASLLYIRVERLSWIACDLKTQGIYGRFDGTWWAA